MNAALADAIASAAATLTAAGVPEARRDAEEMAACVLGVRRRDLGAAADLGPAPGCFSDRFADLVAQRAARVPLQHLVGKVQFRAIELLVGPGVFVPQPETEDMVAWAVAALSDQRLARPCLVDLCTGSGTVALAMANEVPGACVHAVEKDPDAFAWANRNADARAAAGDTRVDIRLGDAAAAFGDLDGTVDMVLSNPPYVATGELENVSPEVRDHDPLVALLAGRDGLDLVRTVERSARRLLRPGGFLVIEHSDRQGRSAPELLRQAGGWVEVCDHRDRDDLDRFVAARWSPARGGAT